MEVAYENGWFTFRMLIVHNYVKLQESIGRSHKLSEQKMSIHFFSENT